MPLEQMPRLKWKEKVKQKDGNEKKRKKNLRRGRWNQQRLGKILRKHICRRRKVRCGGGIRAVNGNKKERLQGEIRPMADRGSAAASQFPKPDGSEVESSTAGKSRQWEKKEKTCLKQKTCRRADGSDVSVLVARTERGW